MSPMHNPADLFDGLWLGMGDKGDHDWTAFLSTGDILHDGGYGFSLLNIYKGAVNFKYSATGQVIAWSAVKS